MRPSTIFVLALLATGCRTKDTATQDSGATTAGDSGVTTALVDADLDGSPAGEDCDDDDANAYPGNTETTYDGVDNDCDDATADDDLDSDGFVLADDCDDDDDAVNPDAIEVCNGEDDDCNGLIDDAAGDVWYADADGDGFGDAEVWTTSCEGSEALVADASDCDDDDDAVHPDADEICNGLDDDCDLLTDADDPDLTGADTWYRDGDGDGFGDDAAASLACEQPSNTVSAGGDCDDTDDTVSPVATELCNTVDDDCDGLVDDDDDSVADATTWYLDSDGDGHGSTAYSQSSCVEPSGFATSNDDCDDSDAATYPGANESCDGADNDCDSAVDENASDAGTWYADTDGDGYGDSDSPSDSCEAGSATVADATDCDDSNAAVNPGATERCNGADDDCDSLVDDDDPDLADASTWYVDLDGDGYGDPSVSLQACDASAVTVSDDSDCDDSDAAVNPAAAETCNSIDDDCDGLVDDDDPDISGTTTWYLDYDGDGYGTPDFSVETCTAPSSYVANSDDCEDAFADASPVGTESCDGLDNDCSGTVDEGFDADGDGYQDESCPSGDDCDDADAAVNPGAAELCAVGDEDCDGLDGDDDPGVSDATTWNLDYDGDGYGGSAFTTDACSAPSGYVSGADDCDDVDGAVNPGATEACNGTDDDCDGLVDGDDPDLPGGSVDTYYADDDGDGYGDPSDTVEGCEAPSGAVENSDDCDDSRADVSPDGTETCDGADEDCDSAVDEGADLLGTASTCAALDCQDVLDNGESGAADGNYWIDPVGAGSYEIFCDLTSEGGGWTLVANVDDVSDPYFGAQQSEPWETPSVRNETTFPSHTTDISVTTKYASWGEVGVTDVYIVYKNTSQMFLGEGLSLSDPLSDIFALNPATGGCSAEFATWTEDLLLEPTTTPVGLNCNDPNEGWMEAPSAENARIGGLATDNSCCVFNAWLGAAGDRGYATSNLEKTWGAYSSGAEADDNILVFVR